MNGDDFMEGWGVTVFQHPESSVSPTVAEWLHAHTALMEFLNIAL